MNQIRLHIWGDYACFTRPEMKVERVSYDVITPSAARGILAAVHWKPAICGVVTIFAQKETKKFGSKKCGEASVYGALLFLRGQSYANNENGGDW